MKPVLVKAEQAPSPWPCWKTKITIPHGRRRWRAGSSATALPPGKHHALRNTAVRKISDSPRISPARAGTLARAVSLERSTIFALRAAHHDLELAAGPVTGGRSVPADVGARRLFGAGRSRSPSTGGDRQQRRVAAGRRHDRGDVVLWALGASFVGRARPLRATSAATEPPRCSPPPATAAGDHESRSGASPPAPEGGARSTRSPLPEGGVRPARRWPKSPRPCGAGLSRGGRVREESAPLRS